MYVLHEFIDSTYHRSYSCGGVLKSTDKEVAMPSLPLQRTTGIIMLILAVLLILAIFTAETPSTETDDFPEDFANVVDDEVRYLAGQAVQVAVGVFVALLGASLYVY